MFQHLFNFFDDRMLNLYALYYWRDIVLYVEFCSSYHVPEYINTKVLCGSHWNFIPNLRTHFGKFTKYYHAESHITLISDI